MFLINKTVDKKVQIKLLITTSNFCKRGAGKALDTDIILQYIKQSENKKNLNKFFSTVKCEIFKKLSE